MEFNKIYVSIIVVLVLIVIYLAIPLAGNQQTISNTVKQLYDLEFETNSEVLMINETSGVYSVVVRFNNTAVGNFTTQNIFVTKDGKLITDRFIVADNYISFLKAQKDFAECLQARGLRIFGQSNNTATLQLLQAIGNYAYKVYVSCDGANEAQCVQIGVQQVPTIVYNNTIYNDLYTPVQLANCTFQ